LPEGMIHWNGKRRCNLRWVRQRRWVGAKSKQFVIVGPSCRVCLTYRRFVGMCVVSLSRSPDGGKTFKLVRSEGEVSVKKRVPLAERSSVRHLAAMESNMLAGVMPIIEHLALLQYDEGEPRKPGKIFIETQGPAWKVTVKDVDTAAQFSVVAETVDKALESVALLLACEDAPWEPDVWALERKQKKGK